MNAVDDRPASQFFKRRVEIVQGLPVDYFDFTVDVEEQYEAKRGDVKERAEALSIVHFKGTGRKRSIPHSTIVNI